MIVPASDRIVEAEAALAIHALCQTRAYGEAKFKVIFANLSRFIKLSDLDRMVAERRPAELKWQQIVRNVHRTVSKDPNAYDGLLVALKGGGLGDAAMAKARAEKQAASLKRWQEANPQ